MNQLLRLILLIMVTELVGCLDRMGGYIAASSISQNGFARNGQEMRQMQGQEIKVWGTPTYLFVPGQEVSDDSMV